MCARKQTSLNDTDQEDLKQKIVEIAWKLFEEKGYENTTVNEIIKKAGTSKGGFYYHFKAKDELLASLYMIFDREYRKLYKTIDPDMNSLEQIALMNQYISYYIESNVSPEVLAAMYISQISGKSKIPFWGEERYYIQLMKNIIIQGQAKGEIRSDISADDLLHYVLLLERGVLIDWCVQKGSYSVGFFGSKNYEMYLQFMKP